VSGGALTICYECDGGGLVDCVCPGADPSCARCGGSAPVACEPCGASGLVEPLRVCACGQSNHPKDAERWLDRGAKAARYTCRYCKGAA